MIGYHHVLMIIIAVTIILLCKLPPMPCCHLWNATDNISPLIGRMLVILPTNAQHILDLSLLPTL